MRTRSCSSARSDRRRRGPSVGCVSKRSEDTQENKERRHKIRKNSRERKGEPRRSIDRSIPSIFRPIPPSVNDLFRFFFIYKNREATSSKRRRRGLSHLGFSSSTLRRDKNPSVEGTNAVAAADGARLYLRGAFVKRDVRLDAERPLDVQQVFVQLQQKDDENEEGVHHKERKDALVA